jgi:negative regulator of replication initiation
MRTTLTLDDDVLRLVKRYAASRGLTLGEAVSDLVQRALTVPRPTKEVNGVRVFDLRGESPRVTTKKVRELDAEQR